MPCTCSILSPFRWQEHNEASIFSKDKAFTPDSNGESKSEVSARAAQTFRLALAGGQYKAAKKARAPGHYRG